MALTVWTKLAENLRTSPFIKELSNETSRWTVPLNAQEKKIWNLY
jgi:hypothetical protein